MLGHPRVNRAFDTIIVGAGIVGAACADACARAGLRVLVLDRGCIGGGTTAAGMGHIVVMDDSEAQFALTAFSRRLWLELRPELPANVEYETCGTLWIASDAEEFALTQLKAEFYTTRGVRAEIVNEAELRRLEPNLRPGLAGALRVPEDGVLYPPCAARFLLDRARTHGAELRTGQAVHELLPTGGVCLDDGTRIAARLSVNATGASAPVLAPDLPVRPRKGHLVITDRHPGFVKHQLVELGYLKSAHGANQDSVAFNIQPRKTGQMLIGSSRQYDAPSKPVDQPILDRMLNRAIEFMPTLGALAATRIWTGDRAATPDKLPLIGPSPANDRVWLATGHEGLGITTSLGTGRLLADQIMGRHTEIPIEPYLPRRFARAD